MMWMMPLHLHVNRKSDYGMICLCLKPVKPNSILYIPMGLV